MRLIARTDQIKTPEMIKEEELLETYFFAGKARGIYIGVVITNVIWILAILIKNLIIK